MNRVEDSGQRASGWRHRRNALRWGVALALAAASSGSIAAEAAVTSVTYQSRTKTREGTGDQKEQWVSSADCLDGEVTYTFQVAVESASDVSVFVSSGNAGCVDADDSTCFEITPSDNTPSAAGTISITLTAGDIAKGVTAATGCYGGKVDGQQVTLTFVQDSGEAATANQNVIGANVDLAGPEAPVIEDIGTSEGGLTATITEPDSSDEIHKVYLYCNPKPASSSSSGGCGCGNVGASNDGGSSSAGGGTSSAKSANAYDPEDEPGLDPLAAGGNGGGGGAGGGSSGTCSLSGTTIVEIDGDHAVGLTDDAADYECGSSVDFKSTITASGLANGERTAVVAVFEDDVGNISLPSDFECGTPAEVTDFYEVYKDSGGKAGGGICSVRPGTRPTPLLAPMFGLGALGLFAWRRHARRRKDRT